MPNNCVFLVDTYNTLEGVRHAVAVGRKLEQQGHKLAGIRLDSGDLAYLSIEARKILDAAGLKETAILATNDLNETLINSLKDQGATINVWGVGTHLATAYEQPALGGVYKLTALEDEHGQWQYKVKLSEQTAKTSTPGVLQVRRFEEGEHFMADAIYNTVTGLPEGCTIVDPADFTRRKTIPVGTPGEDLLVPVFRGGQCVYTPPSVHEARARGQEQIRRLHPTILRPINPHRYPAGLERSLHDLKLQLILQARGVNA
jgi:nicotinate phosphoribosyltransferase